jgi:hypothetical protein
VRDPDLPLLRESLREAERVLDHQMEALQEVDDKAEQVLAVTLATTGGGLAFFAYASAKVDPGRSFGFILVFAVGFAANVLAAAAFLSGYLGFVNPTVVQAGPAPAWIAQRTTDPSWSERDHLRSVIAGHARYFANNERIFRQVRAWTLGGFALLALAVVCYAGAAFYGL